VDFANLIREPDGAERADTAATRDASDFCNRIFSASIKSNLHFANRAVAANAALLDYGVEPLIHLPRVSGSFFAPTFRASKSSLFVDLGGGRDRCGLYLAESGKQSEPALCSKKFRDRQTLAVSA
jgi:hypothetical protein